MHRLAAAGLPLLGLLVAGCLWDGDSTGRDPVRIALEPAIAGLDDPVFVTHAGDGSGRLFVVEQGGTVRVWKDGALRAQPFLDIESRVRCCGERGLLGLAFHPQYESNGRLFVYYTDETGDIVVAEHRASASDPDRADPAGREMLRQAHRQHPNHNGGMLAFGPDGMLYAGLGDGGSGGDPDNNAQDPDSLLGKVLRIDVGATQPCTPYCVPLGNPFVGKAGRDEVWHYGLRNPWRFSFDRETGDLWIGDVGQGSWEEVDRAAAGGGGLNFGWSRFEGDHLYDASREAPGAIGPLATYRNEQPHCAITGGYVYRGDGVPGLQGAYVFGDYCSGTVWSLRQEGGEWVRHQLLETSYSISSFGEDADGELYVVDIAGAVYKVVAG